MTLCEKCLHAEVCAERDCQDEYDERAMTFCYYFCGWISVDERLPEENGRYLVCVNVSHLAYTNLTIIAVMEYGKKHGFYLYSEDEPVTHWMLLPEAPKMKGGVTAESAIKAVQEAARELKDTPPDDLFGIGSTMQF